MDPMGRAIADYWKTKKADRLRVFSPMFEEDEIPLKVLFRSYKAMPEIERKALDMATGRTLDVGAASGCHSLVLQKKGIDVTAIDISPLAVETMKDRGVFDWSNCLWILLYIKTTFAPSRAKANAVVAPIPCGLFAPVIRATLSLSP